MTTLITPASVQIPGDLDAPLIADFAIHALRVALVERESVLRLSSGWSVPGVYILIGTIGNGAPVEVYVGKATKLKERLTTHKNKPKMDWWRAVAVSRDTTDGFNSSEIGYLEGRIASELKPLARITLIAGRDDLDTTLPAHMLILLDAFVPTVMAALRLTGLDLRPAPEAPLAPAADPDEASPTAGSGAVKAPKQMVEGSIGDLLSAGLLSAGAPLSFTRKGVTVTASVTADGELLVNGKGYRSPSTAAMAAMPHLKAANGWESWRLGDGTTIAALRKQLPPKADPDS